VNTAIVLKLASLHISNQCPDMTVPLNYGSVRSVPMSEASKAKDEVLDELADEYDGSEWLAVVEAVERMHYRWDRYE